SYRIDRDSAPLYYLDSDAPLYYYSFTDAYIAMAYRSLTKEQQARFDPMITGFNPADMYAADHVRRVLQTFPGVFEGIGEFSLHKEFVTSKVATDPPSLSDPALDRLFSLAEEAGLVVLVHCDVDTPFPRTGMEPAYYAPLTKLFRRHPNATIVWAHLGLGRVVRPLGDQGRYVVSILEDAKLGHVMFDLSWSETAKYIVATPASVQLVAEIITKYPDRFLFGTDEVAPDNENDYLRVYRQYQPLWERLPADVRAQVLHGNYERIFDDARKRVRRWEQLHPAVTNQREPIVHRATGPD
ncbi:MAG TPA: amidohydrolase family protein, partial [Vicinamibacterales bacterium]|nr:amidohydrolase family protein [Vicinamibacterales bacterium]